MPRSPLRPSPPDTANCCHPKSLASEPTSQFLKPCKALADETRLGILSLLSAARGELCACDIESHFTHLAQPTVSHHLKLLREAGLVSAERRATWVYYSLNPEGLALLRDLLAMLGGAPKPRPPLNAPSSSRE